MSNMVERWLDNRRMSTYRELSHLQETFDRLLSDFSKMRASSNLQEYAFTPSCEVVEESNSYLLRFDMPGVSKDMVKVEVDKDQITVRAERKEEKKTETKKKYLSEVFYGSYERSFSFPTPVDDKKVDAKFENGVLTVTVPKTEAVQAKQIPVH